MTSELPGNLTGNFLVRALRDAFRDSHYWLPRKRDQAILRRHSLKLRYWPDHHPEDESGNVLDLDWSWIKALKGHDIGELRINDTIGNRDNLRVIFYRRKTPAGGVPTIWILAVLQKKRDDFTQANITAFKARKVLVDERADGLSPHKK